MRIRRIALGLFLVLALAAAGVVYAVSRSNAALLPEAELLKLARGYANSLGMVGEPYEEHGVITTMGAFLTLTGSLTTSENLAFFGETRETPTFVYQVRGDIPFGILFPHDGKMEYFLLQIDPVTGELRAYIPKRSGETPYNLSRMPVDTGDPILKYQTGFEPLLPPDIAERVGK